MVHAGTHLAELVGRSGARHKRNNLDVVGLDALLEQQLASWTR